MHATDRPQTSDRRQTKASLNAFAVRGRRHNNRSSLLSVAATHAEVTHNERNNADVICYREGDIYSIIQLRDLTAPAFI